MSQAKKWIQQRFFNREGVMNYMSERYPIVPQECGETIVFISFGGDAVGVAYPTEKDFVLFQMITQKHPLMGEIAHVKHNSLRFPVVWNGHEWLHCNRPDHIAVSLVERGTVSEPVGPASSIKPMVPLIEPDDDFRTRVMRRVGDIRLQTAAGADLDREAAAWGYKRYGTI